MTPAVLLLLEGTVGDARQQRTALDYAVHHGLVIVSVARDPMAALTVVTAGLACAVLAAWEPLDGRLTELVDRVTVVFARQRAAHRQSELIRAALARTGGNVELVACVLGLPVRDIQAAKARWEAC